MTEVCSKLEVSISYYTISKLVFRWHCPSSVHCTS